MGERRSCWCGWNKKNALCYVLKRGGKGKQSGSVLCGVCAIRAKENEEEGGGGKGLGYPGRRGVENKLRTLGEQRQRENMSADRGEVNEWKLQKENKTLFRMCDMLNIVCSQQQQQQQQPGFGGVRQPVRLY